eukprot:CAMPEP_0194418622 /NCGR_PEP_ID=MMETSP0176-20130528/17776_1 /TAXON_ID=216777 /ORGANISM="Proboscia alata, Strain PI-D3" /LENGTH=720 /DNA_ID=CAMNT_0039225209 /DNA_START=229 /DNA_END=2391 /DNA_ORIENTATION=-
MARLSKVSSSSSNKQNDNDSGTTQSSNHLRYIIVIGILVLINVTNVTTDLYISDNSSIVFSSIGRENKNENTSDNHALLTNSSYLTQERKKPAADKDKDKDKQTTSKTATIGEVNEADWFDHDRWWSKPISSDGDGGGGWNKPIKAKDHCFYIENVCHRGDGFVYDSNTKDNGSTSRTPYQPPWELVFEKTKPSLPKSIGIIPKNNITSANTFNDNACFNPTYSPIPNHMILYSEYNDMLGEFYVRTLPGLFHLLKAQAIETRNTTMDAVDGGERATLAASTTFQKFTQLYFHNNLLDTRGIMDSHKLFLGAFSMHPVHHIGALLDHTAGCSCMKRLFFCGYKYNQKGIVDSHEHYMATTAIDTITATTTMAAHLKEGPQIGPEHNYMKSTSFRDLRHFIIDSIDFSSNLKQSMDDFRLHSILEVTKIKNVTLFEANEWRIVGFTQRNSRRKWLELNRVLERCNQEFNEYRIACVEINVESESSSVTRQAAMHRPLSMMVGIHGAQLTQAILMKDESFVVELLPWVPPFIQQGPWTRTTDQPTPLGAIFNGTELNHAGVRLPRESAPVCLDEDSYIKSTSNDSLDYCTKINQTWDECCHHEGENRWDVRDFKVDYKIVDGAITKLLMNENESKVNVDGYMPRMSGMSGSNKCSDMQRRAKEGDFLFVLYNVVCIGDKDEEHNQNRNNKKDVFTPTSKLILPKNEDVASVHHFYDKVDAGR